MYSLDITLGVSNLEGHTILHKLGSSRNWNGFHQLLILTLTRITPRVVDGKEKGSTDLSLTG